jgi:epoxide hydrolase-like predicted phosphatase
MAYKVLIFDLGNVIFEVSFDLCFEYWSQASGVDEKSIRERFSLDADYEGFEKNAFPPEEFRRRMSDKLGLKLDDEEFDKGWCNLYKEVYPGMASFLDGLKNHYRLVALTNTNIIHEKVWKPRFSEIMTRFEKVYSSPHMGCRKPDAEIYEKVLDDLGIKTSEALFMDDNKDNIEGARKVGIESILVISAEQMMRELRGRLGEN